MIATFRSLTRALLLGFVRDRGAMIFTVAIPVIFLVLLGSIYRSSSAPQVKVAEVGQVSLLDQAVRHGQLGQVVKITKTASLATALQDVRKGDDDAAVQQQGNHLSVHYSIADQTTAGVVNEVLAAVVQQANARASGRPPAFTLTSAQVEDKSLKPIQYLAPGLLGWAIASGATFGASITLVTWREKKLLRRLRLTPASTVALAAARITVSLGVAMVQLAAFLLIATTPYFGLKLTAYWWMAIPIVAAGTLAFL
ncbi:MAG: ABC transporter permease, partial [Actinomycetota bacterium]